MPWYNDLRPSGDSERKEYSSIFPDLKDDDRRKILKKILNLRSALEKEFPDKSIDKNMILGSWNLKEFGHLKKRLPESYFYISEIINRYDLIAIQEIKTGLKDLDILMRLLGKNFNYIITDITEGAEGNSERFGYIYDNRKIKPSGLSGEIVLWDDLTINSKIKQFKRTPSITGFQAGWKSFIIINIHLHPDNSTDDRDFRKKEVELLFSAINHKLEKNHLWSNNLIILGDTNLYKNNQKIVDIFYKNNFFESNSLNGKYTNVSDDEIYDRIFLSKNNYFEFIQNNGLENGNVFHPFDFVFTEESIPDYRKIMKAHKDKPETLKNDNDYKNYFNQYWKRSQLSDHNPIWIEIKIDSTDLFLNNKRKEF